jgi:RNA recognition motif-containing protein
MITMKNQPGTRELYISEISYAAEEEDLRKLFVLFGKVTSIHMVKDPKSGLFRGSAFIRMATPAQAKDALNSLDGTYLVDRCIKVEAARPKQSESSAAKQPVGKRVRTPHRRR